MGVIEPKMINAIKNNCDVTILCATAKPYEIGAYDKSINILGDANIQTIFSFVQDTAKSRISNKYSAVFFSEYTTDNPVNRLSKEAYLKISKKNKRVNMDEIIFPKGHKLEDNQRLKIICRGG